MSLWSPKGSPRTIDVLVVGGTWNPGGDGVTGAFVDALNTSMFTARMVAYPADYGSSVSYAESVAEGKRAVLAAIDRTIASFQISLADKNAKLLKLPGILPLKEHQYE